MRRALVFLLLLLGSVFPTAHVWFFYSTSCPHCHKVLTSGVLENASKLASVSKYAVDLDPHARDKFFDVITHYGLQPGVPLVVVFEKDWKKGFVIQGDEPIIQYLLPTIRQLESKSAQNTSRVIQGERAHLTFLRSRDPLSTLLVLIPVAASDSINPCIISVLALLLATLRSVKKKEDLIMLGGLYVIVVFVTYFLIGVLLRTFLFLASKIITFGISLSNIVNLLVSLIVFFVGLLNIKEVFAYGVGPSLTMGEKEKEQIIDVIKKGTTMAILFLAALVTVIEFPCSGIMYLAIIQDMVNVGISGLAFLAYLVIYNVIFVIPLVIMIAAVAVGRDVETVVAKFERERLRYRKLIRLIMGVVLILLAVWIFPWPFIRALLG